MKIPYFKYKKACRRCGTIVKRRTSFAFTCRTCKTNGHDIINWLSIKKTIKIRDNYTCQICGVNKRLHVHHKDKNRWNNKLENLITLCNSCHLSQHGKNFEKPIEIKVQKYGTRLIYESSKEEIKIRKFKNKPRFFNGI